MVRIRIWICTIVLLVCVLPVVAQQPTSAGSADESVVSAASDAAVGSAVSGSGTTNFIPIFTNSTTLGNSALFQLAGKVGIGNKTPAAKLDVSGSGIFRGVLQLPATANATATAGTNSQPFDLRSSSFDSSTDAAVSQHFRWQAEPLANDTASPSGTLNLLFASGTGNPAETGLSIGNNGVLSFAPAQILPGADVTGDLGDSDQIGNVSATGTVTGGNAIFSSSVLATTINATGNLSAGGTLTAAAANITGNILAGSIGTAGAGNFGSVVTSGNVSSLGAITATNFSGPNAASFVLGSFTVPTSEAAMQVENVTTGGEVAFLENGNASNPFSVLKLLEVTGATGDFMNCERPDGTELCSIDSSGTFHAGSDFAEALPTRGARTLYEPGDVLVMANSGAGVEKTSEHYSRRVVGIFSTRPGFLGADKGGDTRVDKNDVPVAITGIVPAKVSAENGPVRVGDLLVTASTPGYAMKATDPKRMVGAIVGKALEPLLQGAGVIRVLVTMQ